MQRWLKRIRDRWSVQSALSQRLQSSSLSTPKDCLSLYPHPEDWVVALPVFFTPAPRLDYIPLLFYVVLNFSLLWSGFLLYHSVTKVLCADGLHLTWLVSIRGTGLADVPVFSSNLAGSSIPLAGFSLPSQAPCRDTLEQHVFLCI